MIRRLLGGLAVLTISGSLASASTITWYNNIFVPGASGGATNSPQGTPSQYTVPFATTVEIPRFDLSSAPSGFYHVLNSVQIVLNWAITGTVSVANFDIGVAHTFNNATANIPLSLIGPDSTTVNATAIAGPTSGVAAAGLSITPFPGLTGSGSSNNTVIGAGLSAYQGFGSANLSFSVNSGSGTYGGTQTDGSGNLFFGGTSDVGGSIMVTYNYETLPVPEPGTFVLMGGALVGVGLFVRRRRNA
jgi:hypothetical protein